jgi:tripartite-type tricarboxylate transporter receptor subunit TctC
VSLVVSNDELLVVNVNDPANTVPEFIANAKKRAAADAGRLHGHRQHPAPRGRAARDATKANLLHVPYKGAAPAITDVMGGRWQRSSATFRVSSRR